MTSVDLPEPGHAGDRDEEPERDIDREVLEVVGPRAHDPEPVPRRSLPASRRDRHPELAAEVPAGERGGVPAGSSSTVAFGHDLAAESARPRAQVDHVVGGLDGVGVVLDDDDGVAEIAQPPQRGEQALVVPLVQPDARLVEDVEHADQPRPDLGGQPDPLRLAAGERRRAPGRA